MWDRKSAPMFHDLASAIIAQQLSSKAADTIQGRVMKLTSRPMSPKRFLETDIEELRGAGLSRAKVSYIRNVAEAVLGGLTKNKLLHLDDAEALKKLTGIKGIGCWTAEMYLIFGLKRPDIMSLGDAGLQRAARVLYNKGKPKDGLLEKVSAKWEPYRSIASWYLWKSLSNEPL